MRKRTISFILTLILIALWPAGSIAQSDGASKMSLGALRLLEQDAPKVRTARAVSASDSGAVAPSATMVQVIVTADPTFDFGTLAPLGVQLGSVIPGYATLHVPVDKLEQLAALTQVQQIDVGAKVAPRLNLSVPAIAADTVLQALGDLPVSYTGKGVIVGIVDMGFDYTHPTFYNRDGQLRIKRVWNQLQPGNQPAGFTYGAEYQNATDIIRQGFSSSVSPHGTHVAGIAAGSGGRTGYQGIAPDADLVLVQFANTTAEVVDGIKYILNYARKEGKPAVVNLSLGTHEGPHDGTSATDKFIDAYVDSGLVVVVAAGNEGAYPMHTSKIFGRKKETVRTGIALGSNGETTTQIWLPQGGLQVYEWSMELWKLGESAQAVHDKYYLSTYQSKITTTLSSGDSRISIEAKATGRMLEIKTWRSNTSQTAANYMPVLVLRAQNATVHLWNTNNTHFVGTDDTWLRGDLSYTVGEMGTATKAITVGSYDIRDTYTSLDRVEHKMSSNPGYLSQFSSHGPTTDYRMKPDVIAPGGGVISSVNSFYFNSSVVPSRYTDSNSAASEPIKTRTYYYAPMSGTSMATPMVTGAVALMLEANPNLRADTVRALLRKYAQTDKRIAGLSTNQVGYGKINIYHTILHIDDRDSLPLSTGIGAIGKQIKGTTQTLPVSVAPNPAYGSFRLSTPYQGEVEVRIYDLAGDLMLACEMEAEGEVNIGGWPQGVYLVHVTQGNKEGSTKLLVRQ